MSANRPSGGALKPPLRVEGALIGRILATFLKSHTDELSESLLNILMEEMAVELNRLDALTAQIQTKKTIKEIQSTLFQRYVSTPNTSDVFHGEEGRKPLDSPSLVASTVLNFDTQFLPLPSEAAKFPIKLDPVLKISQQHYSEHRQSLVQKTKYLSRPYVDKMKGLVDEILAEQVAKVIAEIDNEGGKIAKITIKNELS
jgi:hypothetical protein